ncbi:MAG: oligosaccharide flippase family protein [Phormidesmis sp.]
MSSSSLLKSGLWITASNFSRRFFALLSNLVLARLLLPADFGVISIAYIFWSLFTLFIQNSTGLFILYKGTSEKRYLDTTYSVSLAIGAVIGVALAAIAPLVARFFDEPVLTWLLLAYSVNLFLSSGYYVYAAILMRQKQYGVLAKDTFIASMVRLLFTIGSAFLGLSYWSFAIGDAAFWILSYVLVRYQSHLRLSLRIDPQIWREVTGYCLSAVGSSFGFYANSNLDNFAVGKLLGKASLGYYNLAYQLAMALSTILNPVMNELGTPVFAEIKDLHLQEKALSGVVKQIAYLATPLYALIFLIVDQRFIVFVFGENWAPVANILPWLLLSTYSRVLNGPLKVMLSAKGMPNINAKVNLAIAPVAVGSFFLGAHLGGVIGVAIAAAIILGLVWTLFWWWVGCRAVGWSMARILLPVIKPFVLTLAALVVAMPLPSIVRAVAFTLLYLGLLRLFDSQQLFSYMAIAKQSLSKVIRRIRQASAQS